MSFNFVEENFHIGQASPDLSPQFIFYKKGFRIGGNASIDWREVTLSGVGALTLTNALTDSLLSLKLFGGTEQRNLPSGYTQNQFIWMKEDSYLLTNIIPTYDGHYELDFQTTTVSNVAAAYMGGRSDQSPAGLIFSHGSNNALVTDAFGQRYSITYRIENNTRYKYVFNNKVFTLYKNGVEVETYTFTSTNNSGAALAIKAINTDGSIDFAKEGIYFYGFKAWNNQGQLIADYIPATKLQGLVPGIYDKVTNTFFTATSGQWESSTALQPSPDTPMDIVCNNGTVKVSPNLFDVNNVTIQADTSIGSDGSLIANVATKVCMTYLPVKPNTTYTISGDILGSNTAFFRIAQYKSDKTFLGRSEDSTGQRSSYTFTTGADTYFVRFHCITEANLNTYQLEQGSVATSYMPYGQIYVDGTTETIDVHSKNLFDKNQTYISGFVNSDTGQFVSAGSGAQRSFCISCQPNTTYVLSGMTASSAWGSFTSDAFNSYATNFTIGNGTITSGANDKYLIGMAYTTNGQYDYRNTLQVEQGTTATTYEPYFNGGSATAENLFKVGTYQDVQSVIDGVVTRNVGVKVLDGTEDWSYNNSAFLVDLPDRLPQKNFIYCTHFQYNDGSSTTIPNLCIGVGSTTVTIFIKYQTYNTVETFKQYLADQYANGTPVIVVYPLATATTETVTGQLLTTQAGTNIVEIMQASMDNLGLEVSYKATV